MSASSVGSVTPMPSATEPQFVLFDCMWEGHTEPMHLRQLSVKHWGSADILSLIIKNNGRMVHAKRKAIGDVIAAQYKSLEEEILAGQDYSNCLYRIGVLREMRTVCLNVAGLAEDDMPESLDEYLMEMLHRASGEPDERALIKEDYRHLLTLTQMDPYDRDTYAGLSRFCR